MPKTRKKERIVGDYFVWLLGKRGEVYTADGRSNDPPQGRHSLGVKDYDQALESIRRLDLTMAVKAGKAERSALDRSRDDVLSLDEGWRLYRLHTSRPTVAGGASLTTQKRYRAVFEKFIPFAQRRGVCLWNHVTRQILEAYAGWLDSKDYADATQYLELNTLKQAVKWMIENEHLPAECRIVGLKMSKSEETDTYCWAPEEVAAIIELCRQQPELSWLGDALTALACTGLRISELAALRWRDVDLENNSIYLTDESGRAPRRRRRQIRKIKNRRSRAFPIHADLRAILLAREKSNGGLIFRGPRGGVIKPDTVRRILVRDVLSVLAGRFPTPKDEIGFADGRLHSFRHFFCSRCANSGVPEQVVMKWLGHRSSRIVRRYYHLHDAEAQRQMQKLSFVDPPDAGA